MPISPRHWFRREPNVVVSNRLGHEHLRPPRDPLGIVHDLLDAVPERVVDDARRRPRDLDVLLGGPLDALTVRLFVLATHLDPARAAKEETARIRLVLKHPTDSDGVPGPADVGGDTLADQLGVDAVEAAKLGEAGEDSAYDLGLERLDLAPAGYRIVPVAEAAPAEPLRDAPGPSMEWGSSRHAPPVTRQRRFGHAARRRGEAARQVVPPPKCRLRAGGAVR